MADNHPFEISVIIPTFNRKTSLEKTLRSLLAQTYPHDKYEIIVVDDYSTDGTKAMIEDLKKTADIAITYYANDKKKGQTIARNIAFAKAHGSLVASTDSDVECDSNWLENGVRAFNDATVAAVEGKTVLGGDHVIFTHGAVNTSGGAYITANMFYRKTVLEHVQYLDEELNRWANFGSDFDLAQRIISRGGRIVFVDTVIVRHPVYAEPTKNIIKKSLRFGAIPYLYKKHGQKIHPWLAFKAYRLMIAVLFLCGILSLLLSSGLALAASLAGIACIMLLRLPGFANVPLAVALKALPVYCLFSFLASGAFLYGCLYYRVVPNTKMIAR